MNFSSSEKLKKRGGKVEGKSISTVTLNQHPSHDLPNRPRATPSTLPSTTSTTILPLIQIFAFTPIKNILLPTHITITLDFIIRTAKETRVRASDRYFAAASSAGTESVVLGRASVEGAAAA